MLIKMPYNPNSIKELERVMQEIRGLVDRPRIQQKTWVAMGKTWLPILQIIHGELTKQPLPQPTPAEETPMAQTPSSPSILIEAHVGRGTAFVNIALEDIHQVEVYDPNALYNRGRNNIVTLKNGQKYITKYEETQRVIAALHRYNEG